jgi:4-diphosphocytidyl-2-C-methyl-D-erythritol kinase
MLAIWDVPAPAKLNVFLHVVGRRPNGYHLLQSVFMLIDWCDTLHFERTEFGSITRENIGAQLPELDLIVRTARILKSITGCRRGAHITVHKRIPSAAGMGGGSSDSASTLLALNRLWQLGLSVEQLAKIGLILGADVPFFVHGRNAWVEGIGESIKPIELPSARFLVVKPPQGISTASIFGSNSLKRNTKRSTIVGFIADPYGFGRNDLQPVAQTLYAGVEQGLDWLAQHGLVGRMTGSGSAVFAHIAENCKQDGFRVFLELPSKDWQMRVCCNLAVHPLFGWAVRDT